MCVERVETYGRELRIDATMKMREKVVSVFVCQIEKLMQGCTEVTMTMSEDNWPSVLSNIYHDAVDLRCALYEAGIMYEVKTPRPVRPIVIVFKRVHDKALLRKVTK